MMYIVLAILSFAFAIRIISTKEFPYAHGGHQTVYLGHWAYIVGGLFLIFSIYIFYLLLKKKKYI